ncbi:hypothetical protein ACS0TY_014686 [Phlomoides rotata]
MKSLLGFSDFGAPFEDPTYGHDVVAEGIMSPFQKETEFDVGYDNESEDMFIDLSSTICRSCDAFFLLAAPQSTAAEERSRVPYLREFRLVFERGSGG